MAIASKWLISQLECYPEHEGYNEVVFTVHWRRQAVDGVYVSDVYGSQALTLDPLGDFTPYAELTPAIVEGWLEDAMGAKRIAELDAALAAQIENQQNPPIITPPLPWG